MTRRDEDRREAPEERGDGLQLGDMLGVFAISAFLAAIGLLAFFATTAFAR